MFDVHVDLKILDPKLYLEGFGYAKQGDVGIDLRARENKVIHPNEAIKVGSGIACHIKHPHAFLAVFPRSGTGSKGLVLGNLTGIIDTGYQGEIILSLWNRTNEAIQVNRGDKVAQMVFLPTLRPLFNLVVDFAEATERGADGFGSTGK